MQLYQWRGRFRNFGDELNAILWPALLPDFFDQDGTEIFLGIGSVLDNRHPPGALKIVAGAGYGGYESLPVINCNWTIHWVRGPQTAGRVGLPPAYGLGDPASLIDAAFATSVTMPGSMVPPGRAMSVPGRIGFMPHFETLERGPWKRSAALAGMHLIDPRSDVRAVLDAIGGCSLIVSEALHGVIVADALRIPWIALAPLAPVHGAKWGDWGAAMGVEIAFQRLAPSSLGERLGLSRAAQRSSRIRGLIERSGKQLNAIAPELFVENASRALRRAAWAPPQLSRDTELDRSRDRMRQALRRLQANPRADAEGSLHRG